MFPLYVDDQATAERARTGRSGGLSRAVPLDVVRRTGGAGPAHRGHRQAGSRQLWSEAAHELYGWSAAEAQGQRLYALVVAARPDLVAERVDTDLAATRQSVRECAV